MSSGTFSRIMAVVFLLFAGTFLACGSKQGNGVQERYEASSAKYPLWPAFKDERFPPSTSPLDVPVKNERSSIRSDDHDIPEELNVDRVKQGAPGNGLETNTTTTTTTTTNNSNNNNNNSNNNNNNNSDETAIKPPTNQPVSEPEEQNVSDDKDNNHNNNNDNNHNSSSNNNNNHNNNNSSSNNNSNNNNSSSSSTSGDDPLHPGHALRLNPFNSNHSHMFPGLSGIDWTPDESHSGVGYPTVASHRQELPHPDNDTFSPDHHHPHKPYPHHDRLFLPHGTEDDHAAGQFELHEDLHKEFHEDFLKHHGDGLEHSNSKFYDTRGLLKFMEDCQDCVVSSTDSKCPLDPEVVEMKKWAHKMEDLLSKGCPRAASCDGPGSCCINNKLPFKRTLVMVTNMLTDVYNLFQEECNKGCKVDGNWSAWSEWSNCSATCGNGTQTRNRQCSNPSATSCGLSCPGDVTERRDCYSGKECTCVDGNWGAWQAWTSCSATCGQGTRNRRRVCDNPPASACGRPCYGMASDFAFCSVEPVDGVWGQWSSWSRCLMVFGQGFVMRRRTCLNLFSGRRGKACDGPSEEWGRCYKDHAQPKPWPGRRGTDRGGATAIP